MREMSQMSSSDRSDANPENVGDEMVPFLCNNLRLPNGAKRNTLWKLKLLEEVEQTRVHH